MANDDSTEPPADNPAEQAKPAAVAKTCHAEGNKEQPRPLRFSEFAEKFFHGDTSFQIASGFFAVAINYHQRPNRHAHYKTGKQIEPAFDFAETDNQHRHNNQVDDAPDYENFSGHDARPLRWKYNRKNFLRR